MVVKIDNKSIHVELHHLICKAAEAYYRLSGNIPKALLEVNQHIHGHFDEALYNVFMAVNTSDKKLKLDYLNKAKLNIYSQYTHFEYLIKTHALTPQAANTVLTVLHECYVQACKWHTSVLKGIKSPK